MEQAGTHLHPSGLVVLFMQLCRAAITQRRDDERYCVHDRQEETHVAGPAVEDVELLVTHASEDRHDVDFPR